MLKRCLNCASLLTTCTERTLHSVQNVNIYLWVMRNCNPYTQKDKQTSQQQLFVLSDAIEAKNLLLAQIQVRKYKKISKENSYIIFDLLKFSDKIAKFFSNRSAQIQGGSKHEPHLFSEGNGDHTQLLLSQQYLAFVMPHK